MASENLSDTLDGTHSGSTTTTADPVAWGTAFQSTEFVNGLKTVISEVLKQSREPVAQVNHLEQLGDPARTFHASQSEVGRGSEQPSQRPRSGMLNAPTFIQTSEASDVNSQAIPLSNDQSTTNVRSHPDHEHVDPPNPSVAVYKSSPESAFVLGPGRSPIPAKLVKKIVSHEYIELSELIPENLEDPQSDTPSFTIEGASIVQKAQSGRKRDISDILTWVECFNSFTAVLTSFFPFRSRDLLAYMALIIRTSKRFGGMAWYNYDRAYRREAAASSIRDWSMMRPDLYNYHTAVVLRPPSNNRPFRQEPRGSSSGRLLCHSWNAGFCTSTQQICRYRHTCSFPDCHGYHRLLEHQRHANEKRNRSPDRSRNTRRAFSK